jgi:hypothetical protein
MFFVVAGHLLELELLTTRGGCWRWRTDTGSWLAVVGSA